MTEISAEELAKVNSFPRLVSLLRDKLEWPINEEYEFEDVIFEYEPHELGLRAEETAKLREIHQLRPLVTNQPWGIFFLSFDDKTMSVTVLRRILRALVVKQRASGQSADRAAWLKEDLVFAANFGKSGARELAFVHFSDGAANGDLPVMKVLGWNAKDTTLHNRHAADLLGKRLAWPDDPADQNGWRDQWSGAFEVGHREVITTSKELAVRLAALAGDIRARANQLLAAETDDGPMRTMLEAFRKNLIHDLDEDGFADMFAQTICYGMLAARISRPMGIIADNLADMVPRTNPFLKELFASFLHLGGRDKRQGMDFDELGVGDVVDLLNSKRTVMDRVLEDFGNRNPKKDPVIHFYEDFLHEYDRDQKVDAGIFYTPPAVVGFIVRGVDEMLRTEFDLPLGLADTSTWGELAARNNKITVPDHVDASAPFVQILDPATGTGTFLVEVIDLIHKRMVGAWQAEGKSAAAIKAAWNAYVPAHLLPRLTAFELKMAAYAIAHMKIGLKLVETGYTFGSDERAHILLTNSLQPPRALDLDERARQVALAHEAERANEAKLKTPFTVIIGNPPYSQSITENPFIIGLMESWKKDLNETKSDLNREEWKFLRYAASKSEKFGNGILGFIINRDYIDGITKRIMRKWLLDQFPGQLHYDLNGDVKGEISDENVFDIQQGVSIIILSSVDGEVRHRSLVGTRDEKLIEIEETISPLKAAVAITPRGPYWKLAPRPPGQADAIDEEYAALTEVNSLFPIYSSGIQTKCDRLSISWDEEEMWKTVEDFSSLSVQSARSKFGLGKDGRDWTVAGAQKDLSISGPKKSFITPIQYKPFDVRYTYWTGVTKGFLAYPRREVMQHVIGQNSACLMFNRQIVGVPTHFFVSEFSTNHGTFYLGNKGQDYLAPLWLKPSAGEAHRRPNIDHNWALAFAKALNLTYEDGIPRGQQGSLGKDFIQPKAEQISLLDPVWDGRGDLTKTLGPRDLFDYIYAVLHAPGYRSRYAEFLKSDFPRIPTPATLALFAALVPLGRALVALHLLKPDEAPLLKVPEIRFAGTGTACVERGYPQYENGKVIINPARWFEDVPKATWEFHVGGYQPCEKWLKDRAAKGGKKQSEGRILTDDDTLHYRRMVAALTETRRLMAEIDKVIDNHGGWPGAFNVNETQAVNLL